MKLIDCKRCNGWGYVWVNKLNLQTSEEIAPFQYAIQKESVLIKCPEIHKKKGPEKLSDPNE